MRDALVERVAILVPTPTSTPTSTSTPNDPAKFHPSFGSGALQFRGTAKLVTPCRGCVLRGWVGAGNPSASRGIFDFLKEALALLPAGWKLRAARADSGFFAEELLEFLEARELPLDHRQPG